MLRGPSAGAVNAVLGMSIVPAMGVFAEASTGGFDGRGGSGGGLLVRDVPLGEAVAALREAAISSSAFRPDTTLLTASGETGDGAAAVSMTGPGAGDTAGAGEGLDAGGG